MKGRTVVVLCALLLAARDLRAEDCPAPTHGDKDAELAKTFYDRAAEREASDPEGAIAQYRCARLLSDRPAISLRLGAVEERMGHWTGAADAFAHYLALAGTDAPDATEMTAHIDQLRKRAADERTPPPPATVRGSPVPGFILLGGGGALAAAGVIFTIVGRNQLDAVAALPAGTPWVSDQASGQWDAGHRNIAIGVTGIVVGGLVAAVGLILVVTLPRLQSRVAFGPTGVGGYF
jgi:hypothetical protein